MGAITVVRRVIGPVQQRTLSVGELHFSASYTAGGEWVDPVSFGLATVDDLFLDIPHLVDGPALTSIQWAVRRSELPARTATNKGGASTLSAGINDSANTIPVTNALGFHPAGKTGGGAGAVQIGSELITYTGKTATTLTGAVRGAFGSTAAAHLANAIVLPAAPIIIQVFVGATDEATGTDLSDVIFPFMAYGV